MPDLKETKAYKWLIRKCNLKIKEVGPNSYRVKATNNTAKGRSRKPNRRVLI